MDFIKPVYRISLTQHPITMEALTLIPQHRTPYEIQRSEQSRFDGLLYSAMEVLDDMSESNIRDGDYKKMCDILMELKKTTIYTAIKKRVIKNRPTKIHISLAEKVDSKAYTFCPKCDRPVINTTKALKTHQKLDICINVNQCKISAVVTGKKTNTGQFKFNANHAKIALILNNKLSRRFIPAIGDDGILTKSQLGEHQNYYDVIAQAHDYGSAYGYDYTCHHYGIGADTISLIVKKKYQSNSTDPNERILFKSLDDILGGDVEPPIPPTPSVTRIIKIKKKKIAKREIVLEH